MAQLVARLNGIQKVTSSNLVSSTNKEYNLIWGEVMFEKRKLKKRIKKLNQQVAAGDLQAMYDLAMIYLDGTVLKKNSDEAYRLLKQAADAGHIQSKTYLISHKISKVAAVGAQAIADIQSIFK